jgi:hypothetical protein
MQVGTDAPNTFATNANKSFNPRSSDKKKTGRVSAIYLKPKVISVDLAKKSSNESDG